MEKPKNRWVHFKKTKAYPEMGVLALGRVAIPLSVVGQTLLLLWGSAILGGIILAGVTNGAVTWLLSVAVVLLALALFVGFLVLLIVLVVGVVQGIKRATAIHQGREEDKRF